MEDHITGGDLIASALRLIGVLASGESPSGPESADALLIAQQMLDQWQSESLMIFSIQRLIQDASANPFFLIPGQQVYTVGTGGNFNIPRPARIERFGILSLLNPSQPLELPLQKLTYEGWAGIPVKAIQSSLPQSVFDDSAFPTRNLSYWPIPNIQVQAVLYPWIALSTFPDLTTDVTFPPGYTKAIRFNLAVDLAPEFGVEPPATVVQQAQLSKAKVESINAPLIESHVEMALLGTSGSKRVYNWLSDNANMPR